MGNSAGGQGRGGGGGERGNYWYDPDAGLYFGNQFLMGDGEFPRMDPESFLFGDMADLNHLSRVPGLLARPPSNIKHTNTVRSLLALHKDSIRLVYHANDKVKTEPNPGTTKAHIEFSFDADVPCSVSVYFAASEKTDASGLNQYTSKLAWPSKTFEAGLFQQYSFPDVIVDLATFAEEDLFVDQCGARKYPIVIEIQALVDHPKPHTHTTFVTLDRSGEGVQGLSCKPIIQRLSVDGLTFVLKEIYGIENKAESGGGDDDDNAECVVCMSDVRDTMALPCRHLCLCNPCAEVLRFQNNKCPICRTIFHSLLQIRVLRDQESIDEIDRDADESEDDDDAELVPPGFALVSIVSALTTSHTEETSNSTPNVDGADGEDDGTASGADAASDTARRTLGNMFNEDQADNGGSADFSDSDPPSPLHEPSHSFSQSVSDGSSNSSKGKGKASVAVHDYPSNERLEIEDHVVAVPPGQTSPDGHPEFSLPGVIDSNASPAAEQVDSLTL